MDDKTNILKQAKYDIFLELKKIIEFYNEKGGSFSVLKKYFKKKKNFEEILEDIKHKSNHLFEDEKEYKIFVKEILMDLFDDKIAHEKDKMKKTKTFENWKHLKKYEDIYIEPDYEKIYNNNKKKAFIDLENFVEGWVDNYIGLDAANYSVYDKYGEIIVFVGTKNKRKPNPEYESGMKREWKETAEDLLDELNREGFDKYWDLHIYNYTNSKCVVGGDSKKYGR